MHFGSFYCSHVNPYSPKNESKAHCLSQKMQAKTAQKVNDTDMFMCLCSKPISRTAFMVSQKKKKKIPKQQKPHQTGNQNQNESL